MDNLRKIVSLYLIDIWKLFIFSRNELSVSRILIVGGFVGMFNWLVAILLDVFKLRL